MSQFDLDFVESKACMQREIAALEPADRAFLVVAKPDKEGFMYMVSGGTKMWEVLGLLDSSTAAIRSIMTFGDGDESG